VSIVNNIIEDKNKRKIEGQNLKYHNEYNMKKKKIDSQEYKFGDAKIKK